MSSEFIRVTNLTRNNLVLAGDNGIPNVSISGIRNDENYIDYADINMTDVIGNILLCNDLSVWVSLGLARVTRGSVTLNASQVESFKTAMTKDIYDSDLNDISDRAEQLDFINTTNITHLNSPYTILSSDGVIDADVSGGTITINLPALSSTTSGRVISIYDTTGNSATNNITIVPSGTDKINGVSAPAKINRDYDSVNLIVRGGTTGWYLGLIGLKGDDLSRVGDTIYEIFGMNDFPTPVGGVITLQSGRYEIKNSLVTDKRFFIPAGSSVTWTMDNQRYNTFTYTGTGTLFSGTNFVLFVVERVYIIATGNNAQLFDLSSTDPLGSFNFRSGALVFTGTGTTLGTFNNPFVRIFDMYSPNFTNGLTFSNSNYIYMNDTILQGVGGSGTCINVIGSLGFLIVGSGNALFLGPSESGFYLDPLLQGTISISNTLPIGPGSFFKVGTTGPIASFTDVSTSPTAVTVTNDGGDALFSSIGHGLNVGETAVHTTFTESSYNGSHIVTEITSNTYKVGLSYVSDDSGLFETTTTQVNDVGHGLSNGTSISIFRTINFDAGYKIFNVQSDSFEITLGKAFPGSESTGNWDTSSLTGCGCGRSKYVTAFSNGDQPDSKNLGTAVVGGNTQATAITITGQFEDLNLNALMAEAGNIELWKLIDSTTGEIRYDGVTLASLTFGGLISAVSAGAANRFDFRLLKKPVGGSYGPLPSPDDIDIPMDVNGTLRSMSLLWPITANPGDIFKIQVANKDGTSDIVIDTLKINIS